MEKLYWGKYIIKAILQQFLSEFPFLLLSHGDGDVVTDGAVYSVHSEAAQKQKLLESCQSFTVLHWEGSLLWSVQVIPLKKQGEMYLLSGHQHQRQTCPSERLASNLHPSIRWDSSQCRQSVSRTH